MFGLSLDQQMDQQIKALVQRHLSARPLADAWL